MAVTISGTSGVTTPGLSSSNSVNITSGSGVFPDSTSQRTAFVGGRGAIAFYGSVTGTGMVWNSNGSATFTIPAGITALKVTVLGGGGNGASYTNVCCQYIYYGGGGGAGGLAIKYLTGLTPGNTINITIGTVGASSSVASGTQSITTITATGGSNGSGSSGGAGGTGSGGDINVQGNGGGSAYSNNLSNGDFGYGSSSIFGGAPSPSQNAYGFGCGGAGKTGGSLGKAGIVVFEW